MLEMTTHRRRWKGNPGQYALADSRLAQLPASERQDELQVLSSDTDTNVTGDTMEKDQLVCEEKAKANRELFRQFAKSLQKGETNARSSNYNSRTTYTAPETSGYQEPHLRSSSRT